MKENIPFKSTVITVEMIAQLKAEKLEEVKKAKEKMSLTMRELFTPMEKKNGMEGIMQHLSTGIAVYDGVRTGIKVMQRVRSFMRRKKK